VSEALLTLNAGSSSLKACLFEVTPAGPVAALRAEVTGLGVAPSFEVRNPAGDIVERREWASSEAAFEATLEVILAWAEGHLGASALLAVGHRIVHGGRDHTGPRLLAAPVVEALERLAPLAPLHQPHNIAPVRAIAARRPGLAQIGCFDTAFHTTMPAVATRFALPRMFEEAGVRRYGFHGLSYEHIARRLRLQAPELARGRVIAAHLGAGASLCAMTGGRSVDTTMGFTALDGLVMATRCGAIDPGVVIHLQRAHGLSYVEVEALLYRESGLMGVSGFTGDMRALLASRDPRAVEAVELYVHRIVREIGALASSLGGFDGLVFSGGVGENAAYIRARVCARLAWLGLTLDRSANEANAALISSPSSGVAVMVVPADEEATIARQTLAILRPG
jgi:acetate kinase